MKNYQYTTEENEWEWEPNEHEEDTRAEVRTAEYLEKRGLKLDEQGNVVRDLKTRRVPIICSCGIYTCCMVTRFGHPEPVFEEDIKPLWPQSKRDRKALELKGAMRGAN